ncbi:MAG TPA: SRPBCC family protein, partial [Candidatus Dormibacteraeota bacterium]|nr:SRPBCC family protein [Candidatus Dormibacteraeota bacterium]
MSTITVQTSRAIAAKPEDVYAFLRDYRKRPQILTPNFLDYTVEEGGEGAGTLIRYRLQAARRERAYQMRVDEPVEGRVLR